MSALSIIYVNLMNSVEDKIFLRLYNHTTYSTYIVVLMIFHHMYSGP